MILTHGPEAYLRQTMSCHRYRVAPTHQATQPELHYCLYETCARLIPHMHVSFGMRPTAKTTTHDTHARSDSLPAADNVMLRRPGCAKTNTSQRRLVSYKSDCSSSTFQSTRVVMRENMVSCFMIVNTYHFGAILLKARVLVDPRFLFISSETELHEREINIRDCYYWHKIALLKTIVRW